MVIRGNEMNSKDEKQMLSSVDGDVAEGISLDEFRAELDVFSGPLDLLLHLIKREEVDILEIPISHITDSYLSAVKAMEILDINIASEFLVMAATLMDIKSRSLIPDPIDEEDEDPKDELIYQLLEYKKYKHLAARLSEMAENHARMHPRRPPSEPTEPPETEVDVLLNDIDIWDCVSAYGEIIREIEMNRPAHIVYEEIPLAAYMEEIKKMLNLEGGDKSFLSFFSRDSSRARIIGIFLALLELLRKGAVELNQDEYDQASITVSLSE